MKQVSVLALGVLMALGAHAESSGTYVSVGVGRTSWDVDCSGVQQCSKSHTGLRLFGGAEVSKNVAAELFYLDLGKVTAADSGVTGEIKGRAIGAGVALTADFTPDWRGAVRLGVANVHAQATASGFGTTDAMSKNSTQPVVGLGLSYAITPTMFAEANYERTRVDLLGEARNVGMFSLGLGWRF